MEKVRAAVLFCGATFLALASLPGWTQSTLVGYWEPVYHEDFEERVRGPAIGDYAGLPITEAARIRADSWDASLLSLPEHQCEPHASTYGFHGIGTLRIWETRDSETQQLLKIDILITWQAQHREIWMDGRPSPAALAPHTWQGFSRGHWEGDVLVVETDHLKASTMRRNGLPLSDRAMMREYFFRHADVLTHVSLVTDPVYLTEPLVRSDGFRYALNGTVIPYPCRPATEVPRAAGEVPHHLPGQNPSLEEVATQRGVPLEAVRGGARTALPEYADYIRTLSNAHPAPANVLRAVTAPVATTSVQHTPIETKLSVLQVQGNVYVLSGPWGDVAVQIGSQGVLAVDTGPGSDAERLLGEIRRLAGTRILRYIIDTAADPERIGGNARLRESGSTILGGNVVLDDPRGQQGATVIAHENTQLRLATPASDPQPIPAGLWPTETFSEQAYDLFFNDEAVQLIHPAAAHTDGDVMVFFRKSDVLITGDILDMTSYPVIDVKHGGSINGLIAALNRVIDITVPRDKEEGGTMVVPGRGRLCDEADVVAYRDMVTIIRDRIKDMIERGLTLQQVQASRPTADYDARFGASDESWTPDGFVEAVYLSLKPGDAG